jgi:hypothetical protein
VNPVVDNLLSFPHTWRAEILTTLPLIRPARQFIYPRSVPGEEDALARGALQLLVYPGKNDTLLHPCPVPPLTGTQTGTMNNASPFLATCALGFTDPSMPTGVWSCPNPAELCAVAGGYAYVIETTAPEQSTHIALRPVVEILPLPDHNLLLFVGFHNILAWGTEGLAWQTSRLSWEGLRLAGITAAEDGAPRLHGLGWNMHTDKEVQFAIDLRTGTHTGGGY